MSQAATFPGNRFVGASWRPGADAAAIARLRRLTKGWRVEAGDGWLIASERPTAFATSGKVALALGRDQAFDRGAERLSDAAAMARAVAREGIGALAAMAPPFRAVWAETAKGVIHGDIDTFGLGQLFVGEADGFAGLASSATLLADVLAAPLSPENLAAYAAFGNFLCGESPYAGVTRLDAGTTTTLAQGRLLTTARAAPDHAGGSVRETFSAAVAAMLKAVPQAEIGLSGGLDSRVVLAAIPAAERRGRHAITIGIPDEPSDDVRIAGAIAQANDLDWRVLDIRGAAASDAGALTDLLGRAVAGYDHMANPLEKAAFITAGHGREMAARFSGQNGEILRGFYYPGQPLDARPSANLARRLIALRVAVNDRVDRSLLAPRMRGELTAAAETRMVDQILALGGTWGQTLDRLYLTHRMQNWIGNAVCSRFVDHVALYPFFDAAFLSAALALPPSQKLNSRAGYHLLTELDPALAARPLDTGLVPAAVPTSRLGGKIADLRLDANRVATRLRRRLKGAARATIGSETIAQQWRRLGLYRQLPVHELSRTGIFEEAGLERVASGAWLPDRPTLGFLLMVAGLETRS